MERFNIAQRVVVALALGAILLIVGAYLTSASPFTGWVAYAPLSGVATFNRIAVATDRLSPLGNMFVWLGLVLVWCAGSLLVFRGPLRRRTTRWRHGEGQPLDVVKD